MKTRILEPSQILSVLFFKRGDITLLFPVSRAHNERAALFYYRWCRQMGNSTGSGDNEPAVQTVDFNVRSLFLILEPGGGKKSQRRRWRNFSFRASRGWKYIDTRLLYFSR